MALCIGQRLGYPVNPASCHREKQPVQDDAYRTIKADQDALLSTTNANKPMVVLDRSFSCMYIFFFLPFQKKHGMPLSVACVWVTTVMTVCRSIRVQWIITRRDTGIEVGEEHAVGGNSDRALVRATIATRFQRTVSVVPNHTGIPVRDSRDIKANDG